MVKRNVWETLIGAALLLALFYVVAVAPYRPQDRERLAPGLYAHRGLHDQRQGAPENSLPAFLRAAERGYGVELDVRLTADGQVVVFHDANLARASGAPLKVSELTLSQLKRFPLFGTGQSVPTLAEALQALGGRTPLLVEIKTDGRLAELCAKVMDQLRGYQGSYSVQSFDPRVLMWFKQNQPRVLRGQLSANMFRLDNELPLMLRLPLTNLLTNFLTQPDFVSYRFQDVDQPAFRMCRQLFGLPTAGWTIRSAQDLERVCAWFDVFIFEGFEPEALRNSGHA